MASEKKELNLHDRVHEVLELIRPSIQADGGDVELVSVDDKGVVSIRFLGACIGCPSSDMTLHDGIEHALKSRISAITTVNTVD